MADFRIVVVVDPSGAVRGAKRVEGSLNRVGKSATRLKGLIAGAFAFTAITAGITRAIGTLATFEQSMSTVGAIANATETEFQSLREEAQRLGATTRFSASQAAEGMIFLARAGFEASEVLGTVEGTLRLAQAGALDLGTAADIASNVLTSFRLEVDQTGRVVDVLAKAANSSNTDVRQLGDGLKLVAPIAAGLGVSLEETTAAIGALSDAGLQGTLAGTGLRRVLSELESPAKKTRDIVESLGLTLDQVKPSTVGLTAAIEALADAGVDTGQALELFGDRGGPAFEVLSTSIPKVKELTTALRGAEGEAQRIADAMDDNLNGALLAVKSAFEAVILAVGDSGATGALRSFFDGLASILRNVAENMDTFVNVVQTLAIALGITLAKSAIPAAIAGIKVLTLAIAANPIGFLLTALTLGVSALIAFREQLSATGGSFSELGDTVSAVLSLFDGFGAAIVDAIALIFPAVDDLNSEWSNMADVLNQVILDIVDRIDLMRATFLAMKDAVLAAWAAFPGAFKAIVIDAVNGAIQLVGDGINKIIGIINKLPKINIAPVQFGGLEGGGRGDAVSGAATSALETTFRAERGALNDLVEARKELSETTREAALSDEFFARQLAATSAASNMATNAIDEVSKSTENLGGAADNAGKKVKELKDKVVEEANFMADALESAFSSATDALTDFITTGKIDFKSLIDDMLKNITKLALNNVFGGGGGGGGGLFSSLFGGGGGGGLGSLFGFAHGGGFNIGGRPGRDNNLLSINNKPVARVSRGERIDVTPQGGSNGRPVVVNMTVVTPDAESFQRSAGQIQARVQAGLSRASRRNN